MMVLHLFDNKSFPLQNSLTLHAGKCFLVSADIFQNNFLSKSSFRNTVIATNSLHPDHFVGPDQGPRCLQKISADDKSCHNQAKSISKVVLCQ